MCDLPNENVVLIWMISFAGTSSVIQTAFRSSDLGTSRTFQNDVYGFMASLDSIMPTYTSTLRVTVVTQLNKTNVTCTGTVESFSTIITFTGMSFYKTLSLLDFFILQAPHLCQKEE